jgi:hypothetical protein
MSLRKFAYVEALNRASVWGANTLAGGSNWTILE